MKKIILLLALVLFTTLLHAQAKDILAPYLQVPIVPPFKVLLLDSSTYSKESLPKKTPIVIFYFNPDCGHCQIQIKDLTDSMQLVKKAFFVLVSSRPIPEIKAFAETYHLPNIKNLVIGKDIQSFLPSFYKIEFTPFVAVYNKRGNLIKGYQHGFSVLDLLKQL